MRRLMMDLAAMEFRLHAWRLAARAGSGELPAWGLLLFRAAAMHAYEDARAPRTREELKWAWAN